MNTIQAKEIVSTSVKAAVQICGSQVELAHRAGITQGAVGKYLRKEAIPKASTARRLSVAVNNQITPDQFSPIECSNI